MITSKNDQASIPIKIRNEPVSERKKQSATGDKLSVLKRSDSPAKTKDKPVTERSKQ